MPVVRPRYQRAQHAACILACMLLISWLASLGNRTTESSDVPLPNIVKSVQSKNSNSEVTLVIASQTSDNTTWLTSAFSDWDKKIYLTDDIDAPLGVPANKGRESMAYLTYIIDHYDEMPSVMIFQHAQRYQWHNDDPLYDGQRMLSRLQIPFVKRKGYVNLRCVWTLGCPDEIRPFTEEGAGSDPASKDARAGTFYRYAFEQLFPDLPVPRTVGASCCAQFAVTAEKVRERPRRDYERYRRWLFETTLSDDLSGRILEYSWHIIFGQEAVHCPQAQACYCNIYGLCRLECQSDGTCESQYALPKYATLPEGWPDYGWEHEWRNVKLIRLEQEKAFVPMDPRKELEHR